MFPSSTRWADQNFLVTHNHSSAVAIFSGMSQMEALEHLQDAFDFDSIVITLRMISVIPISTAVYTHLRDNEDVLVLGE